MRPPPFPQEILDKITDGVATSLGQHSQTTLRALALTSQEHFLPRARSYLFQVLRIKFQPSRNHIVILENNPSLFRHVRVLHLAFNRYQPFGMDEDTRRKGMDDINAIIDNLEGLVALNLDVSGVGHSDMLSKLYHPTLVHLSLSHVMEIPFFEKFRIPHSLPQLRTLRFCGRWGEENRGPDLVGGDGAGTPSCRRCRGWSKCDLSPTLLRCPQSLYRSLVALKLDIGMLVDHRAAWYVIMAAPTIATLKVLELCYQARFQEMHDRDVVDTECFDEAVSMSWALPSFPSLEYLAISTSLNAAYFKRSDRGVLTLLTAFLRFASAILASNPQPLLRVLSVNPNATDVPLPRNPRSFPGIPGAVCKYPLPDDVLEGLDKVLASTTLFPSLAHTRVTLAWEDVPASNSDLDVAPFSANAGLALTRERFATSLDLGTPSTKERFDELERGFVDGRLPLTVVTGFPSNAFWSGEWPPFG